MGFVKSASEGVCVLTSTLIVAIVTISFWQFSVVFALEALLKYHNVEFVGLTSLLKFFTYSLMYFICAFLFVFFPLNYFGTCNEYSKFLGAPYI